jgi:hypothetical protein
VRAPGLAAGPRGNEQRRARVEFVVVHAIRRPRLQPRAHWKVSARAVSGTILRGFRVAVIYSHGGHSRRLYSAAPAVALALLLANSPPPPPKKKKEEERMSGESKLITFKYREKVAIRAALTLAIRL